MFWLALGLGSGCAPMRSAPHKWLVSELTECRPPSDAIANQIFYITHKQTHIPFVLCFRLVLVFNLIS